MATIFVPNEFYCPITGDLMRDPVSEPEGHTYERNAIMKWLSKSKTSPMTRKGLDMSDMKDNVSMKKSIESIKDKLSADQLKIDAQILDTELKSFNDVLGDITMKASVKDDTLFMRVDVPNVDKRQPVDIVMCIDVSGSMGSDAPVKGNDGKSTSYGISVLSLTVAAAKTILNTLDEKDNISIVTYCEFATELFTNVSCTNENKNKIRLKLDCLVPTNTTNIWDGLKTSLDILRLNSPPNKLKVIKLLTDGVPNIEPNRGHEYMLDKYFKDHDFKCMINCYGFGYNLKSELLDNGNILELKLGLSHTVRVKVPSNDVKLEVNNNIINVSGFDAISVGNFVESIRRLKKPDAYKGKGFWLEGESRALKEIKKT